LQRNTPGELYALHKPKEKDMILNSLNKVAQRFITPSKRRQIPDIRAFKNYIPIVNCLKNGVRKTH
jgi:hypothetical protein